jgi:hypothetical protein
MKKDTSHSPPAQESGLQHFDLIRATVAENMKGLLTEALSLQAVLMPTQEE